MALVRPGTAQIFLTPLAVQNRKPPLAPPAPAGYRAKAVHLDGGAYLSIPSLAAPVSPLLSWVGWFKLNRAALIAANPPTIWVNDPVNYYTVGSQVTPNLALPYADVLSFASQTFDNSAGFNFTTDFSDQDQTGGVLASYDQWTCWLCSADVSAGGADDKGKFFRGDNATIFGSPGGSGGSFTFDLNGIPLWIFNDSFSGFLTGDVADFRLMPGVSLLDESYTIPLATRRLFIDAAGKPVDPAIATAALGAPAVLFSGDAADFATNQGTGGAFTLTGALTDADTSPSD